MNALSEPCLLVINESCVGFGTKNHVRWMSCLSNGGDDETSNGGDDETMTMLGKTDISKLDTFDNLTIFTMHGSDLYSFKTGYAALKTVLPKAVDVFYFKFIVMTDLPVHCKVRMHVEPLPSADTEPVQNIDEFQQQFVDKDLTHIFSCTRLERKTFEVDLRGKSKTPWRLNVLISTDGHVDAAGIKSQHAIGMHHDVYFE